MDGDTVTVDVENWYGRYGPMVLRRCKTILGSTELAEEAMQDVFAQVCEKRDKLADQFASALLYRMATNTSLNLLRAGKRRPQGSSETLDVILSLDSHAAASEAKLFLQKIFGATVDGDSTRTMAYLHFVDGMNYQEVASIVGFSVSGVRKRLEKLKIASLAMRGEDT